MKIYDSMGRMINNVEWWKFKFEQLKQFIDTNNNTSLYNSKNKEENTLGQWFSHQKTNYAKKTQIMNTNNEHK